MSFVISNSSPSRIGGTSPEISAGEFYGASLGQGLVESMFSSIYRMSEYQATLDYDPELNPFVDKAEANHYAQEQGLSLTFDKDPTLDEMQLLMNRATKAQERQSIIQAGNTEGGLGSFRTYGQFGTQFLGSVLTPVDLPLMFVPIVGSSTKAATMGRGAWLARGLITEEALAAKGLAMKGFTAAIIEGSVGQAITEIPLFISNQQSQVDYTANDFFANVAAGGAFGAGINTLRLAFKGAGSLMKTLSKETRETMGSAAMTDFLEGKPLDPGRYVNLDDEVSSRRSSGELVETVNRNDADFKEKYSQLSPKEKSIVDFNTDNKLIDDKGLPIVVYHGRTWDGDQFDSNKLGSNTGASSAREGFFFAGKVNTSQYYILHSKYQNDPRVAEIFDEMEDINAKIKQDPSTANDVLKERFQDLHEQVNEKLGIHNVFRDGGNVSAFLLSAKNPKIVDFEGSFHRPQAYSDIIKQAKAEGHDAVVIKNTFDGGPLDDIYVVFDKESIRSAYDYRVARTAEQKLRANKQAVDTFAAREEEIKVQKQTQLEREIELGKTINPEERVRVREFPTDDDVAKMQQEIDELNDMMGLTPEEMDMVVGNTKSVNRDMARDRYNTELPYPIRGAITKKVTEEEIRGESRSVVLRNVSTDEIYTGRTHAEAYVKAQDNMDSGVFESGFITKDGRYTRKYQDYSVSLANQWDTKIQFSEAQKAELKKIEDSGDWFDISDKYNAALESFRVNKPPAPLFSKHPEYRRPVYSKVWEQYLPKKEGENPTWAADEFVAAAAELHPSGGQLLDELFELDPSLKEMPIGFKRELDDIGASGEYLAETHRVNLASDSNIETIAHELIHASIVRKWRQDLIDVDPKLLYVTVRKGERYLTGLKEYASKTENKPMANLVEAYLDAVEHHATKIDAGIKNRANNSWESFAALINEPHYGLLNFDEFITEAVSNRTFQLYLNEIPSRTKGTILSYFVDAIKSLFQLDTKQSLLDDILFNYAETTKVGPRAPGDYLKGLQSPKATNLDINKNVLAQTSNCILNAL